jgi:hypothetical protein
MQPVATSVNLTIGAKRQGARQHDFAPLKIILLRWQQFYSMFHCHAAFYVKELLILSVPNGVLSSVSLRFSKHAHYIHMQITQKGAVFFWLRGARSFCCAGVAN